MRIAIVHKDRCHAKKCGTECILYCPRVRTGDETVIIGEDGKALISEELCVGCGICIKKCPFDAIDIVSLPEELEHPTHRYGKNGFALYGLPIPVEGKVTGILGANGIGKSTAVKILSGQLRPNLGNFDSEVAWEEILKRYAGTELFDYLQTISKKTIKIASKPQYIDYIPSVFSGTVRKLLSTTDERKKLSEILRELAAEPPVVIVEHDLAILDMLADTVHVGYGKPAVFGIITRPKGVRVGINQYLEGYLLEENVRFRDSQVVFEKRSHDKGSEREPLFDIPAMTKKYETFQLTVNGGTIRAGEVLGVVGANGMGKRTFARLLAGGE